MKKIYLSAITLFSFIGFAQESNLADVLRFSMENLNGTARYRGMGGAFGAVGADLSGLSVNPAGAALFSTNTASGSLTSYNKTNNSSYFGNNKKANDSSFDMNQIGGVLVFTDNSKNANWNKFTIGLNYENVAKFNNFTSATGVSSQSIDSYFLNKAQGLDVSFITLQNGETISSLYSDLGQGLASDQPFNDQQAFLGYESFIIEANSSNSYFSNVPFGGKYQQTNNVETTGYNGKMALNFATAYKNKLFLGMNMNFYFTDYRKRSSLFESNNNAVYTTGSSVQKINFNNELYTYGSGFSLQLGAIYKVNDNFRLGVNYDSPTWYSLTDELTQSVYTDFVTASNPQTNPATYNNGYADVAPDVINIFPVYNIQTPQKITGSAAILFNKKGLLSVDYGYKDYSTSRIKPKTDGLYNSINNQAKTQLGGSKEIKIGGEYRVIKQLSVRGGYRFEESPFITDAPFGDLKSFSTGLGYSWGDTKLDVSYTNEKRNYSDAFLTSNFNYGQELKTLIIILH